MKLKKSILGLALSLVFMIGMSNIQKTSEAQIGWGISAYFGADNDTSGQNTAVGAFAGAGVAATIITATKAGAEIGLAGGIVGVAVGAVVGGL